MKLEKIKFTALILTVLMISAVLLNCGGTDSEDINTVTDEQKNENAVIADDGSQDEKSGKIEKPETEEITNSVGARPDYDLPEGNFDGYNFRIISRSYASNSHWWNLDIAVAEETGDPINDAVYLRNKIVEEKYNIKIINIPSDDVGGNAAKSIKSGSDDYDLVVIGLMSGQEILSTQGLLLDLNEVPYVDLTQPWWDQKAVEQLSINNKLFASTCDMTIRDKDATQIYLFSKTLVENYELENPYELVLSGKWIFDKAFEMMKTVTRDLNSDGIIDDEDQVGLISQLANSRRLFNAAGEYIGKLNADKVPEITIYNERAVEVIEKVKEIQSNRLYMINAEDMSGKYADIWDQFQIPMFSENRSLFYNAGMNRVTLLRSMETDFGIIPPPKFNEQQDNYCASVGAFPTSAVSVPITVSDREKTGLILETLAYESRYILLPAYYDVSLKTKFARDAESIQMLDIILANRLYDLGEVYNWGGVFAFFDGVSNGKDESLTTYWEKNENLIKSDLQKTIAKLDAVK